MPGIFVLAIEHDYGSNTKNHQPQNNAGRLAYCTWDSDQLGHRTVASRASWSAVFAESRRYGLLAAIFVLDLKPVLKELAG